MRCINKMYFGGIILALTLEDFPGLTGQGGTLGLLQQTGFSSLWIL